MARFAAILAGCGDEGFEFTDNRFSSAKELRDWLSAHANRPCWITLGDLTVFSQNIIAIEKER